VKLSPGAPGATLISLEDIKGLIPSITLTAELNEWEYENNTRGRAWAFSPQEIAKANPLTEEYILTLHRRMFGDTWRWAGTYRKKNANLGCQFYLIAQEIWAVLREANYWVEHEVYSIDEIGVRIHHRLVKTHPFTNGNGRHTRMLADIFAVKYGRPEFSWGRFDLGAGETRETYIALLKEADQGNIQGLLQFSRS
jgi:Fic-DOC domain mobile mystery protein B